MPFVTLFRVFSSMGVCVWGYFLKCVPTRASKEPLVEGSRAVVLPGTNCYVLGR